MNKKKSGFTLMELIIALSITVAVLAITSSMFITGNKVYNDTDVKSTLQIEGQKIQEKISDIGMQGEEVVSIFPNVRSGEVDYLIIKSYVKNDDVPRYFKIQKSGMNLIINEDTDPNCSNPNNDKIISKMIDKLKVDSSKSNLVKFDIILKQTKGFSKDVSNEITFTINFRNRGN